MSKKWGNGFGHFSAFFELQTVFESFLGIVVENAKLKKEAPGTSFNFLKKWKPSHQYLSPLNVFFHYVHFLGPNWVGGTWYGIFLIRQKPTKSDTFQIWESNQRLQPFTGDWKFTPVGDQLFLVWLECQSKHKIKTNVYSLRF